MVPNGAKVACRSASVMYEGREPTKRVQRGLAGTGIGVAPPLLKVDDDGLLRGPLGGRASAGAFPLSLVDVPPLLAHPAFAGPGRVGKPLTLGEAY